MRKIWIVGFMMLITLFAAMDVSAELIPLMDEEGLLDYAVNAGILWTLQTDLEGTSVYMKDEEWTKVMTYPGEASGIAANDHLIALSIQRNDRTELCLINPNGALETIYAFNHEVIVQELVLLNDYIAVQWKEDNYNRGGRQSDPNAGANLSLFTLDGEGIQSPFRLISNVSKYNSDELLIKSEFEHESATFWAYNIALKTTREIGKTNELGPTCGTNNQGVIICVDHQGIATLDLSTGQKEFVKLLDDVSLGTIRIQVDRDTLYIGAIGALALETIDLKQVQSREQRSLTLINAGNIDNPRMGEAVKAFVRKHPNVRIQYKSMSEEQLLVALMSGEDGVDVLAIQSNEVARYVDAGVIAGLETDIGIQHALTEWIDLGEMVYYRDVLWGIPYQMTIGSLDVNDDLIKYLNISTPEHPYEWNDLFALAETFNPDVDGDGMVDYYFLLDDDRLPVCLQQYMVSYGDNPIMFMTDSFYTMMESYKKIYKKGMIFSLFDEACPYERALFIAGGFAMLPFDETQYNSLPWLSGVPVYTADMSALSANKHSDNLDIALEFLRIFASGEIQRAGSSSEIGFLKQNERYKRYDDIAPDEAERFNKLRDDLGHALPRRFDVVFYRYAMESFSEYLDDKMDAQALAFHLQQKYDMMAYE